MLEDAYRWCRAFFFSYIFSSQRLKTKMKQNKLHMIFLLAFFLKMNPKMFFLQFCDDEIENAIYLEDEIKNARYVAFS